MGCRAALPCGDRTHGISKREEEDDKAEFDEKICRKDDGEIDHGRHQFDSEEIVNTVLASSSKRISEVDSKTYFTG